MRTESPIHRGSQRPSPHPLPESSAVALAKIVYGQLSGSISILSDGFHSLTDGASNVVALVGLRLARKPPDANHPYGHRKFETLAAGAIALFLLIDRRRSRPGRDRSIPVRRRAVGDDRRASSSCSRHLAINIAVVRSERKAATRLSSELLLADARHTQSDVLTSLAVIAALVGSASRLSRSRPAGGAGHRRIHRPRRLRNRARHGKDSLGRNRHFRGRHPARGRTVYRDVLGCHHIRSRGSADHVFLDMHIWMDGATPLTEAHAISHRVKDLLMERYPQIADAIIHIEPPPRT